MSEEESTAPVKGLESEEVRLERGQLLDLAGQVAEVLLKCSLVKKVGVYGSLARGVKKFPSDVDIAVFLDTSPEDFYFFAFGTDPQGVIGISPQNYKKYKQLLSKGELSFCPLNIHFFPDDPSIKYLSTVTMNSIDPTFLLNMNEDIWIYYPDLREFKKASAYSLEQLKLIKEISFDSLKKRTQNDSFLNRILIRGRAKKI